jgi:hypothetical protein
MKPIWDCPAAPRKVKEDLFECLVRPALVFSCQSWVLSKKQKQRIDCQFTKMRRIAIGIPQYVTREPTWKCTPLRDIYKNGATVIEAASTTIKRRRLRLLGHVLRRDVPMRDVLCWVPSGVCQRGCHRSLFDSLLQDLPEDILVLLGKEDGVSSARSIDYTALKALADKKDQWYSMIDDVALAHNQSFLREI